MGVDPGKSGSDASGLVQGAGRVAGEDPGSETILQAIGLRVMWLSLVGISAAECRKSTMIASSSLSMKTMKC